MGETLTEETLGQKQRRFAKSVAGLINEALELGYEVSLGDAYRDPRVHGEFGAKVGYGAARSCHKLRLAIDLNLFRNGEYLGDTSAHKQLGEWWEKQGADHVWGGRFRDGNHYSIAHNGAK